MALNEHGTGGTNGGAERDPRLERLYREAAHEAPPAHLDAAVLAAARREVGSRPRSVASALRRWHVPVSIAAVVVVSVTLVILVREEEMAERPMQAPVPAAATPAERAAAPRTPPTPGKATRNAARTQSAAPEPQRQELRDDVKFSAALGKREDSSRAESGPPPSSSVAAVATPEPAAKPLPEPFRAASPGLAEERAAPASADTVVAGRLESAPAVASESDRPAPGAQRAMSATPEPTVRAIGKSRAAIWEGFEKEPPEKWLARIEELRKQGRSAEAEEMLSEFKRRFPEHPHATGPR
jgi:hypothetical protein